MQRVSAPRARSGMGGSSSRGPGGAKARGELRSRRTRARVAKEETDVNKELKQGIASFYDESSNVWETIWGEHMHHGYYDTSSGNPVSQLSIQEHRRAQVLMIDKVRSPEPFARSPIAATREIDQLTPSLFSFGSNCAGLGVGRCRRTQAQERARRGLRGGRKHETHRLKVRVQLRLRDNSEPVPGQEGGRDHLGGRRRDPEGRRGRVQGRGRLEPAL